MNDDPETLEAILEWGNLKHQKAPEEDSEKTKNLNCPILVSSLENFRQCCRLLYKFGYRITLPDDDATRIEAVLTTEVSIKNICDSFMSLTIPNKRKISRETINFDPVERFMRFKAWANPEYISIEFLENEKAIEDEIASGPN